MITYSSDKNKQDNGTSKRVKIIQTNIATMVATGQELGNGPYHSIDLSKGIGDITYHPQSGEEWIITKILGSWMLDRRTEFQNQGVADVMNKATPGVATFSNNGRLRFYNTQVEVDGGPLIVGGLDVRAIPPGAMWMWPATTVPFGFLICNGTAISRTIYANLFAVINTIHGAGDGSTTFNLPDLRGRIPVGYTSSDSDFNAVGKIGGSKTSAHSHPLSDAGQAAIALSSAAAAIVSRRVGSSAWTATLSQNVSAVAAANASINGVGASLTGNTDSANVSLVQPYMAINYIIKI